MGFLQDNRVLKPILILYFSIFVVLASEVKSGDVYQKNGYSAFSRSNNDEGRSLCKCGQGATPKVTFESAETEQDEGEDRIIHGIASNPHGWPWMAALIFDNQSDEIRPYCGGSLINSQYILTAAHCTQEFTKEEFVQNFFVILGTNLISTNVTNRVDVRVIDMVRHPDYNHSVPYNNDIAIIKLAVPINFTDFIGPVCLSQKGAPFLNRNAIVAGWGATNASGNNTVYFLREAGLQVIENPVCESVLNTTLSGEMLCAKGKKPKPSANACNGDSGSPLMVWKPKTSTFTQIGLTSRGSERACGKAQNPVVYTRISSFIPFIHHVTNGTAFCANSFSRGSLL